MIIQIGAEIRIKDPTPQLKKEGDLCDSGLSGTGRDGVFRDRSQWGKACTYQETHDGRSEKSSEKSSPGQYEGQTDLGIWPVDESILCSLPDRSA